MQEPNSFAWLLVDTSNVSLVSDIAVSSKPLRVLDPSVSFTGDAANCMLLNTPLAGEPAQCDQFFQFDFSASAPASTAGYSWGFTITSKNGNALPFSSAIVAAGASCPSRNAGTEDSWLDVPLDPQAPGNSPTQINVNSLAIGTHHTKWWIQLKVPIDALPGDTPFSIVASYDTVHVPPPPQTPPPPPPQPPTPVPSEPTAPTPPPPQPRVKKPIPVWVIAVISVSCVLLAAGALFWAWRLSRKPQAQSSYEFY